VTGVSTSPPIVTVTGPLAVLQSIDPVKGISTGEVSISDARANVVQQVELVVPQELHVEGSSTVQVTVSIAPARGEATFLVVPQARNLGADLAATFTGTVAVTLSGEMPALQALSAETIVALVDAQGLGPGLYTLPVKVTPPTGTSVVRIDPGEASFAIGPAP
jgi:YbbR domain-containing protein